MTLCLERRYALRAYAPQESRDSRDSCSPMGDLFEVPIRLAFFIFIFLRFMQPMLK